MEHFENESTATRGSQPRPPRRVHPIRWLLRFVLFSTLVFLGLSVVLTLPLRWINPATTAFILQDGTGKSGEMRRNWTPIERMSAWLPIAVVASEDQKFPIHHGFDLESLTEALADESGRRRGASTITMQLAKNLYLWPGRSVIRKGLEGWFTVLLELFLPKSRILEVYLNVIEYGPGIWGAEAAARAHFNTSARDLGLRQSALLAAVLPNPRVMTASRPSAYVAGRASQITREVRRLGGPSYLNAILNPDRTASR